MLSAATQTPPPPSPQAPRVCKVRASTGTRFSKKVCRTAAQWEALADASTRQARELADRPFLPDCRVDRTGC